MQSDFVNSEREDQTVPVLWFAVYTKHQHEKRVADLLLRKGMETFLPTHRDVRRWNDRLKTLILPLFPCYLFVRTVVDQKLDILKTPGIFHIVESDGKACAIPDEEIAALQRLVLNESVQPHAFLNTGDRVRIVKGALSGIEGILVRVKNQHRVVVSIELLRKSVAVEIDLGALQPLSAWYPRFSALSMGEARRIA
jgi:transcription antitermination factor NusG